MRRIMTDNWQKLYFEEHDGSPLEMTPDPNCPYCKGTGKIQLLVSSVDCECVAPAELTFKSDSVATCTNSIPYDFNPETMDSLP